jgi:hypothetical protein
MPITIKEQHLLALLRECLPVLEFAEGGCDCEDVTAKVRFVLQRAGEHPTLVEAYEAYRKLSGGTKGEPIEFAGVDEDADKVTYCDGRHESEKESGEREEL